MGESSQAFRYALGIYAVLLMVIILRRPAMPSKLDLFLVAWGLPMLFFAVLLVFPLVWHIRGIQ
jgi:hypothetical protein